LIRRLAAALGAVSMALPALHGCTALKAGGDRGPTMTDSLDAGARLIASACGHRAPPPRPKVDGGGGDLDLVFARSHESFGTHSVDDAGQPVYLSYGFDLDDTCTGEGQLDSCIEPPWASASHTDGVEGIDNAAAALAAVDLPLAPGEINVDNATVANQIFRVRSYSGGPDDDQVDVSVYIGFGLVPRDDGGSTLQWDGHDAWMILPDTLGRPPQVDTPTYDLDRPTFHDDRAYVSGWVLVAHVPQALWPTGLGDAPSSVHIVQQLVLAGKLVRAGDQWELQHLVVGVRAPLQGSLSLAARLPLAGSQPLCQSAEEYQMYKSTLCSMVDISAEPDSPKNPCDAISGGSVMEAKQAVLGGIGGPAEPIPPPACAPGVDPDDAGCGP
jgi:hypothetical protein